MNAQLSVLMPVYNAAEYLGEAIESILAQTYKDFEFLIIDDGSSDDSLNIINKYAAQDKRIKVISRPNKGLVATLNEGLAATRGTYIARMDADDIALPTRLAKQLDFMESNPDHVVVGSSFVALHGQQLGGAHHCFINDQTIRHALPIEGCIPHPTAVYRKSAVLKAGGYRSNYLHAEDYDLWWRLAVVGQLANLPEPLLQYRHNPASASYSNSGDQTAATKQIRSEVWRDQGLTKYKKLSIGQLAKLSGEHLPSLKKLQRQLMFNALRHGDFKLAAYFLWDNLKAII